MHRLPLSHVKDAAWAPMLHQRCNAPASPLPSPRAPGASVAVAAANNSNTHANDQRCRGAVERGASIAPGSESAFCRRRRGSATIEARTARWQVVGLRGSSQ
eukprot:350561-Chlamydomonas_euryale.AAC.1